MNEENNLNKNIDIDIDELNDNMIFSDETSLFRNPVEPSYFDHVVIRIRIAGDGIDGVYFCSENLKVCMNAEKQVGIFKYYTVTIPPEDDVRVYYFEIVKKSKVYYYNKIGLVREHTGSLNFSIIRNYKTPSWSKGSIIYQIFPDRFYNGDKSNDVVENEYIYLGKPAHFEENWYNPPQTDDTRSFYGGDIQGIMDKLDYISDMGVEAIYLNPIFVSPSSHKYDIQDYDHIDPHFGKILLDTGKSLMFEKFNNGFADKYICRTTSSINLNASDELFSIFVKKAHEKNIKIILDGVFNHCGAFNKWLDREGFYQKNGAYPEGAYKSKNSKYNGFFKWTEDSWPNNENYDGWWGYKNHPKLNYEESHELYEYMLEIGKKWVSPPYNADGWRLDVAADLGFEKEFNHKFWRDFRKAVKSVNPEAIIIAEHYGDPSEWLLGDEWDTIMNYDAFMEPISWFLTGMEKHSEVFDSSKLCNSDFFVSAMRNNMAKLCSQALFTSMNEISNHDHSRFLTRTNMEQGRLHTKGTVEAEKNTNKGIFREAVVFQMTWVGSPTIYYGDEAGLAGWTDPDNRRTYPWGHEDNELIRFHKDIINLRKENPVLKTGSTLFLHNEFGIISYARFDEKARIIVAMNNTNECKSVKIPLWKIEIQDKTKIKLIFTTDKDGYRIDSEEYNVEDGFVSFLMLPYSSAILK